MIAITILHGATTICAIGSIICYKYLTPQLVIFVQQFYYVIYLPQGKYKICF